MTCILVEIEDIIVKLKDICLDFNDLTWLEINKTKTNVIQIGNNLDNITPVTNKEKFKYVKEFKLLNIDIDNKLEKLHKKT